MKHLLERIELLTSARGLADDLIQEIDKKISSQYNRHEIVDYEEREGFVAVAKIVKLVIKQVLLRYNNQTKYRELDGVSIVFTKIDDGGVADYEKESHVIRISIQYIGKISTLITATMAEFDANDVDKIRTAELKKNDRLMSWISTIAGLYVHEITHAIQFGRARIPDSYRSYSERNKKKFDAKLKRGELDGDYYASPEEIEAYAKQEALKLISAISNKSTDKDVVSKLTNIMRNIHTQGTYYSGFDDLTADMNLKIKRRFIKKMYQELDSYRQHLIDKAQ